jgi:hypothetical protein
MNSGFLWPFVCILAGICLVVLGIVLFKALSSSSHWPRTDGVILESSVESGWSQTGGGSMLIYSPKVVFEYNVDGIKYQSSQLALVEFDSSNKDAARRKAEKYSAGQKVEVYYNPKKHSTAALIPGDPTGGKLPLGMIIVGVLFGLAGAIWLLIRRG